MKNTIGQNVTLTLFGESHGPYVGATLDGVMPGIKVDEAYISSELSKRRPTGKNETPRVEQDEFQIISGVFDGFTTGAPLTIIIPNKNIKSKDYDRVKSVARPSHADYVAHEKYLGFNDYRGGGHFSGRITAAIVAVGAILKKALEDKNIYIGTHIKQVGEVKDADFNNHLQEIKGLQNKKFPILIYINGNYQGLYTLNIHKDNLMGIGEDEEGDDEVLKQAVIMGNSWTDEVLLKAPINADFVSSSFELEVCSTEDTIGDAWVSESFNNMIKFINENDGKDFVDGIRNYVNVERTIDSMLYTWLIMAADNTAKNNEESAFHNVNSVIIESSPEMII